jgi:hypothetical protein
MMPTWKTLAVALFACLALVSAGAGCGGPEVERYPSRFVVKSGLQQSADRTAAYINEFSAKMNEVAEGDRGKFQTIIDNLKQTNRDLQDLLLKSNTEDREDLLKIQDEGDKLSNRADQLIAQGRALLHD